MSSCPLKIFPEGGDGFSQVKPPAISRMFFVSSPPWLSINFLCSKVPTSQLGTPFWAFDNLVTTYPPSLLATLHNTACCLRSSPADLSPSSAQTSCLTTHAWTSVYLTFSLSPPDPTLHPHIARNKAFGLFLDP